MINRPVSFAFFLIAMGNLALMSSIWATTRGSRFLLVTFLFLIPFAIDYLFSIKSSEKRDIKNILRNVIPIFCIVFWFVINCLTVINYDNIAQSNSFSDASEYISDNDIIASNREEYVYFSTNEQAYHLPDLDETGLEIFISNTNVTLFILAPDSTYDSRVINDMLKGSNQGTIGKYEYNRINASSENISIYKVVLN